MDNSYPQSLINQYLKTSSKLKKFDRVVFKRFGPNVHEVLDDFARLALKFEEAGIHQYAAMCFLGVAKCEMSAGSVVNECQAYLKASRSFLQAHNTSNSLHMRSTRNEYHEGALQCYTNAVDRCPDDAVLKAAIIREMTSLQPSCERTSNFSSPAHRIHELEVATHKCIEERDFLAALQHLDDIVDNITERKQQDLYVELLQRCEVLRVLLLVALSLPPARQSPSHIKLLEFYYHVANMEELCIETATQEHRNHPRRSSSPGAFVPLQMKFALAEIVLAWHERNMPILKVALQEFSHEFVSLNSAHIFLVSCICENIDG